MNSWQVVKQLRYLLLARTWLGTGAVVFGSGSVVVTQALTKEAKGSIRSPMALIRIGPAQADPEFGEEPDLLKQTFDVTLLTAIPGDHVGEKGLIGGNRSSLTVSEGRGILEVEKELFAAIKVLTTDSGVRIVAKAAGAARPALDEDDIYIISRDYSFEAWVTATPFYHPIRKLAVTGGVGQLAVTWAVAPDRWDLNQVNITYKTGATAPTSTSDGTNVTATKTATSKTITGLAAGTYSLSMFAGYADLTEGSTDENFSAAVSKTSVVVT